MARRSGRRPTCCRTRRRTPLLDVVAALLAAGADPDALDDERGMSALRRAVRAGKNQTAALLRASRRGERQHRH